MGSVRVEHPCHPVGRHQPAGAPTYARRVVCRLPQQLYSVYDVTELRVVGAASLDSRHFCAQEQLDQKLQQRQARETGICPIREELYAQCFGTTPLRRVMYQLQAQCRDGGGRGWLRYRTTAALRPAFVACESVFAFASALAPRALPVALCA